MTYAYNKARAIKLFDDCPIMVTPQQGIRMSHLLAYWYCGETTVLDEPGQPCWPTSWTLPG